MRSHDVIRKMIEILTHQIRKKTYGTSYLLTGREKSRKMELAKQFAMALNCEKNHLFQACECASCTKISSGNHPDVHHYQLEEDASSIKIETIRALQGELYLKPYEGKVKVAILDHAEYMTVDAQNALLKCLEEPPQSSVLLLLSETSADLLETIRSRCFELRVPSYTEDDLLKEMSAGNPADPDAIYAVRSSAGDKLLAVSCLEQKLFKTKNETLNSIFTDPVSGFDQWSHKSRPEILKLFSLLGEWTRDLVIFLSSSADARLIHADRLRDIEAFAGRVSLDSAHRFFNAVHEASKAIDQNVNQKLVLADLQVAWSRLCR